MQNFFPRASLVHGPQVLFWGPLYISASIWASAFKFTRPMRLRKYSGCMHHFCSSGVPRGHTAPKYYFGTPFITRPVFELLWLNLQDRLACPSTRSACKNSAPKTSLGGTQPQILFWDPSISQIIFELAHLNLQGRYGCSSTRAACTNFAPVASRGGTRTPNTILGSPPYLRQYLS